MKKIITSAIFLLAASASINVIANDQIIAGKALVEKFSCAACHGANFDTPIDPAYPKLAGQHKDYLNHALVAYKRGKEGPNGRGNAIMAGLVAPLSDTDMRDIAAYLHSLPSTLVLRK